MKKKAVVFLSAVFISMTTLCQDRCSDLIKAVSKSWRQDSLTKDGYRKNVYKSLRNSIVDSVTVAELVKYLGKPAKIQKFYSGNTKKNYVQYEYFYWDSYTIPNEHPFERFYIAFVFDETSTSLQYIDDGMYCG